MQQDAIHLAVTVPLGVHDPAAAVPAASVLHVPAASAPEDPVALAAAEAVAAAVVAAAPDEADGKYQHRRMYLDGYILFLFEYGFEYYVKYSYGCVIFQ